MRRIWYEIAAAAAVVAGFSVFYFVVLANASRPQSSREQLFFAANLAIPTLLWVVASWLLVRHWWAETGAHLSTMDPPGRVLATAVAALPDERRQWGAAMMAELAEVSTRSARWRFALSCSRAALWAPSRAGWVVVALVGVAAVAATAAAAPLVDAAVPGLGVFSASFVGLVGAFAVVGVARRRRPRWPAPAVNIIAAIGVGASIAATATFLLRHASAIENLRPIMAVYAAVVLAVCLWLAVAAPRPLATGRVGPYVGLGTALLLVAGFAVTTRDGEGPLVWLILMPPPIVLIAAFVAAVVGRSFRVGAQATVWAMAVVIPVTYAIYLPAAMGQYASNGMLLIDEDPGTVGTNLSDAIVFVLEIVPMLGLPFGVFGAAAGAWLARRASAAPNGVPVTG